MAGKDERISALTVENARLDERVKAAEARGGELKDQLERLQNAFAAASKAINGRARRSTKPKAEEEGGPSTPEA